MKYHYIELDHYKRFDLNSFSHFKMIIREMLQLIIGTNGSGKSSLMAAFSPMPPDQKDFRKNGSKLLKLEHHGKHYTLRSSFDPKPNHSLVLDVTGEELNPGGTASVQKDLVKDLFGFDQEVDDLVQGRECFTSMPAARRKELFIRLCPVNYDYAMKVYSKLREMHRDTTGAVRLQKKKLLEESEKLIQSKEQERLDKEAKSLHECLTHLLEIRKPIEEDLNALTLQDEQNSESLSKAATALDTLLSRSSTEHTSIEKINEKIAAISETKASHQALLEHHNREFLSNERKIKALQAAEQQSIEKLNEDIESLSQEITSLLKRVMVPAPVSIGAFDAFQTVRVALIEVFTNLPANPNRRFSQKALQSQREELNRLQLVKANTLENLQLKTAKKAHMETHKDKPDLVCPACHHQFSLNYNNESYQKLLKDIETLDRKIQEEINPKLVEVQNFLDECIEYGRLFRLWSKTVVSWPVLQPYWDHLNEKAIVTDAPQSGIHYLTLIEKDILEHLHLSEMQRLVQDKKALTTSLKDVGGADLKSLQKTNESLSELISQETQRLTQTTKDLGFLQDNRTRLTSIQSLQREIMMLLKEKKDLFSLRMETTRRIHFNQMVRQVQSELAKVEHVLNNMSRQKAIVQAIEQQITDLQKQEQTLAILVKQMSPTEGLIAQGLLGFINNFVTEMNQFIKKVWSYPLKINACEIVEGATVELDYKFPLSVQTLSNVVKDVSAGSDGMKEIVNLAYRIVAMKYLGVQDSPLLLDEFGITLDETHRGQTVSIVKSLVDQHVFPQLFMVSHYQASYGAFSNAQVCVLNSMNVTVPKLNGEQTNAHVEMS